MRPRVFLSHTLADRRWFFPEESLGDLREFADVRLHDGADHLTPMQLLEVAGDVDFLVTEWATGADATYFERNRKLVALFRVGVEILNVDIDAATREGVVIANLPGIHQTSVIELTLAYMITMARKVPTFERELREGRIEEAYNVGLGAGLDYPEPGFDIYGSTVGLVGLGFIGAGLARLLLAMGATVLAYDPYVRDAPEGVRLVDIRELLSTSDIVSLHAKLTPETRHIIGAPELATMRRHACLVNTARGELIDNVALAEALTAGVIGGAAVDVVETEPRFAGHPLLSAPNCLITPHMTGHTRRAFRALADGCVASIRAMSVGDPPSAIVNKDVLGQPNLRLGRWGKA